MPLAFSKLGIKKMMVAGMLAWVIRYIFFAFGDSGPEAWMLYIGIILHGICYDFFFVTGQIYIDNKAEKSIRNSAQGMITFATYGIGMLIGSYVSGFVTEKFVSTNNGVLIYDWQSVWLIPGAIALLVSLLFIVFFRERSNGVLRSKQQGILDYFRLKRWGIKSKETKPKKIKSAIKL
jgi:MFS family permease